MFFLFLLPESHVIELIAAAGLFFSTFYSHFGTAYYLFFQFARLPRTRAEERLKTACLPLNTSAQPKKHFLFFSEDIGRRVVSEVSEKIKAFSPIAVSAFLLFCVYFLICMLDAFLIVRKTAVYVVYFMVGQDCFSFIFY